MRAISEHAKNNQGPANREEVQCLRELSDSSCKDEDNGMERVREKEKESERESEEGWKGPLQGEYGLGWKKERKIRQERRMEGC